MKFFQRPAKGSSREQTEGRLRAAEAGLPAVFSELPPGKHSWEKSYTFSRVDGYRSCYDSMNTFKAGSIEVELIRERARSLGLEAIFRGDYITFESFPRRNIVREKVTAKNFRNGTKIITMHVWIDIEAYLPLQKSASAKTKKK